MKITVIGAGAMGCLFAGMLCESGHDVCLLARRATQAEVINSRGLVIISSSGQRTIPVKVVIDFTKIKGTELALLFVKHGHTRSAALTGSRIIGRTGYILTLQNGLGNTEIIADYVDKKRILCGTTSQGAMLLDHGVVQHSGTGETVIGSLHGGVEAISMSEKLAGLFSVAAIMSRNVEDIRHVLWNKLFVNVGINALTALTGIRNGQVLESPYSRQLLVEAVSEAVDVARRLHPAIDDPKDAIIKNVFAVARTTANNRSSMGQDIDRRNFTEIDAINGYIVRRGGEINFPVPVNQTLTNLIKVIENCFQV